MYNMIIGSSVHRTSAELSFIMRKNEMPKNISTAACDKKNKNTIAVPLNRMLRQSYPAEHPEHTLIT